jgi:3-isopropylmalate/(R)-2-methylmalate dehydratase large subunit
MTIEAGARAGLIAPDDKTMEYFKDRPMSPKGENWTKAVSHWKKLFSDSDAKFDKEVNINAKDIEPLVTWGTSPQDVSPISGEVPDPEKEKDQDRRIAMYRSLEYMGLKPKMKISDIKVDKIFIGSCTNGRIEDLRLAAKLLKGRKIANDVSAMVVPGSGLVKKQAEEEGIDKVFKNAGFEWREPGCSMCLGMNEDQLSSKERCASTSNRNFEGRQGRGGRTHLVSPGMAVAAAIKGYLADVREIN